MTPLRSQLSCLHTIDPGAKARRVPNLTADQYRTLVALIALGGQPFSSSPIPLRTSVLRMLMRTGCIVVAGHSPARYHVTQIGRAARHVRQR